MDKTVFPSSKKELLLVAFLEQEKLVVSIPGFSFPSGLIPFKTRICCKEFFLRKRKIKHSWSTVSFYFEEEREKEHFIIVNSSFKWYRIRKYQFFQKNKVCFSNKKHCYHILCFVLFLMIFILKFM